MLYDVIFNAPLSATTDAVLAGTHVLCRDASDNFVIATDAAIASLGPGALPSGIAITNGSPGSSVSIQVSGSIAASVSPIGTSATGTWVVKGSTGVVTRKVSPSSTDIVVAWGQPSGEMQLVHPRYGAPLDYAWTLSSDTTITGDVFVGIGGRIKPAGHTLTVTGTPHASPDQWIFDMSGGGSVRISGPIAEIPVAWFGAFPDGNACDVAVQAAVDCAGARVSQYGGATVSLASGGSTSATYSLARPVVIPSRVSIDGSTDVSTVVKMPSARGPAFVAMNPSKTFRMTSGITTSGGQALLVDATDNGKLGGLDFTLVEDSSSPDFTLNGTSALTVRLHWRASLASSSTLQFLFYSAGAACVADGVHTAFYAYMRGDLGNVGAVYFGVTTSIGGEQYFNAPAGTIVDGHKYEIAMSYDGAHLCAAVYDHTTSSLTWSGNIAVTGTIVQNYAEQVCVAMSRQTVWWHYVHDWVAAPGVYDAFEVAKVVRFSTGSPFSPTPGKYPLDYNTLYGCVWDDVRGPVAKVVSNGTTGFAPLLYSTVEADWINGVQIRDLSFVNTSLFAHGVSNLVLERVTAEGDGAVSYWAYNNCYDSSIHRCRFWSGRKASVVLGVASSHFVTMWDLERLASSGRRGGVVLVMQSSQFVHGGLISGGGWDIAIVMNGSGSSIYQAVFNGFALDDETNGECRAQILLEGVDAFHGAMSLGNTLSTGPAVEVQGGCGRIELDGVFMNRSSVTEYIKIGALPTFPVDVSGLALTSPAGTTPWSSTHPEYVHIRGRSVQVPVTLANGDNANVAIGWATSVRVTGPSAAFAITGLAAPVDGVHHVTIRNATAQVMTIKENTGSTAGNRIDTLGAGAVVCTVAVLEYDPLALSGAGAWVLISHV